MKVFLATPVYDGRVIPWFESSLKASLEALHENGIEAHWEPFTGCCYLPIARNKLVDKFLKSDFTDFVFIDSDIEWTPEQLFALLAHPVEIVGGAYRHKTWEETYPVWLRTDEEHRPITAGLSGLIECWTIPTGFMRIQRNVFEVIDREYGDALEIDEYNERAERIGGYRNYFDTVHEGRLWWGEDNNFCRKWTINMKRKLFIDPQITVTHWGTSPLGHDQPFIGDYHDFLSRKPGGANDPGYHGTDIEGYTVLRELQWLYTQAQKMKTVVEVGSFKGRSAHALLSGCASGLVYCVDPWDGNTVWENQDGKVISPSIDEFMKNTAQFPNRAAIQATSVEAALRFQDKTVDMVFIDGNHSYDSVIEDIRTWLPKTRKLLCGHDYNYYGWPGVKKAVDDTFGDLVQSFGTIWFIELEE